MAPAAFRDPPLAGRPPFATEENDEIYSTPPNQRRIRQQPGPDPNNRSSAYNMYDQYLDDSKRQSGAGALGMGFMNGDMDSDEEDDDEPGYGHNKHSALAAATHPQSQAVIPLASPRPGYAAPIAALNLSQQTPPQVLMPSAQRQMPQASPQMSQLPAALLPASLRSGPASSPMGSPMGSPLVPPPRLYAASPAPSVPSTPHPLEAPITPITPAFLRPSRSPAPDSVKFEVEPIMRGNSEDNLLPRRGDRGDDFWRRFSMVAKEETSRGKQSNWLQKTQNGTTSLSRWVWIIGIVLLLCIGGAIGLGWHFTHNEPANQAPKAFGGSQNEVPSSVVESSSADHLLGSSSSSTPHVSPTLTLARRDAYPEPLPTGVPFQIVRGSHTSTKRHSRHVNRTQH